MVLLGHSYGAICCLEAARLTSAVRRLILYEPPLPVGQRIAREMRVEERYTFDAARFKALTTPATLLLGGESPPVFAAAVKLLRETLPDSRTVVLDGQQHVAMDTAPELFVATVIREAAAR